MNQHIIALLSKSRLQDSLRFASTKTLRPHPRSHKRRLYEAALRPILPAELEEKAKILELSDVFNFQPELLKDNEYSEYELAEVDMVRNWIREEKFRVIGICQMLFVNENPRYLAQNQFRLRGLEFKVYTPKTLQKLFKGTPFEVLEMLYTDNTVLLFGRELEALRTLPHECAKYNWLTLLGATLDNRILSVDTLNAYAKLSSMDDIRAETAQILDHMSQAISLTFTISQKIYLGV